MALQAQSMTYGATNCARRRICEGVGADTIPVGRVNNADDLNLQ
jgi:hypothetical protein